MTNPSPSNPTAPAQARRRLILGLAAAGALAACGSRTSADFERLWAQVQGVAMGPATPAAGGQRLLVFFDTRCGFCTKLWHTLQPVMDSWRTLWVPVAILSPASRDEALALLSSADQPAWLHAHMNRQPPPALATDASKDAVLASNLKAMMDLPSGSRAVPQTVGLRGQAMHVVRGALPLDRLTAEFG